MREPIAKLTHCGGIKGTLVDADGVEDADDSGRGDAGTDALQGTDVETDVDGGAETDAATWELWGNLR